MLLLADIGAEVTSVERRRSSLDSALRLLAPAVRMILFWGEPSFLSANTGVPLALRASPPPLRDNVTAPGAVVPAAPSADNADGFIAAAAAAAAAVTATVVVAAAAVAAAAVAAATTAACTSSASACAHAIEICLERNPKCEKGT
jgi:hypothetical protein